MELRLFLVSALLLGTSSVAQVPVPPAGQNPPATKQDPDKPQKSPADEVKDLAAEKERLLREIAYAKERALGAKKTLQTQLTAPAQKFKAIDAGVAVVASPPPMPAQPRPRAARVATKEELANHANDTMLVVNGRAIPQSAYDQLMEFLATNPGSGDEKMRAQRALYELIRVEAVASSFEENDAAERVGQVFSQLDAGKPMAELVKSFGTVPGSTPEGRLEVTRNSVFGPRLEQVAFATQVGKRSRAFRNQNGLVILQVDSIDKGASADLDRVLCQAVQIPYAQEPEAIQKAQLAVNTGQIDILTRDEQVLAMLPEMFRQVAAAAQPAVQPAPVKAANDMAALTAQLEALQAEIAKLQGKTDPESKRLLQTLEGQYAQVKAALRSAPQKTDQVDDKKDPAPPAKKN